MNKEKANFIVRKLIENKVEFEKFRKKLDSFSAVILEVNKSIGGQMDLTHTQIMDYKSCNLEELPILTDLIILGYMASFMTYAVSQMREIPFIEDLLLLNQSMKEILIAEHGAIDIDDYRDIESIRDILNENKN